MQTSDLVVLVVGLAIGAVVGYLLAASSRRSELAVARAEREAALARVADETAAREAMSNEFKVLSAEVLARQGELADAEADQRLDRTRAILAPLEESLGQMNQRLVEAQRERAQHESALNEQVRAVAMAEESLRRETQTLSTALRKPEVRGAWGELTLKRVVEMAGMVNHCHFYEQQSTTTSEGTAIRPDLKVMLGDDAFVYVDSKVPLAAYLDAMATDDEAVRVERLQGFGRNVRTHIDQLGAKNYFKAEIGSPEFVVMFIPSEALHAEAMSHDPTLIEYAHSKGIVIASPTTLIALLRTISYGWRQAVLADSAAEVFELGREIYSRLSTLGTHFDKLGRSLLGSVGAYNQAVGTLEGRVLVTARKLRDLEVTEADLKAPMVVEQSPRTLSAAELLEAELVVAKSDDLLSEIEALAGRGAELSGDLTARSGQAG